ncbi:hypothetical protein FACS1894219_04470 [Clostridia bacterium]|nr:hypothetical protein FACS1894219_04470 [Clostridia bacterium]
MIELLIMGLIASSARKRAEREYQEEQGRIAKLYDELCEAEIEKFKRHCQMNASARKIIVCDQSFFAEYEQQQNLLESQKSTALVTGDYYSNSGTNLLPTEVLLPSNQAVVEEINRYYSSRKGRFANLIFTGGNSQKRNSLLQTSVSEVLGENIPVVYFHCGNSDFVQSMRIWSQLRVFTAGSLSYNPFPQSVTSQNNNNVIEGLASHIMQSMPNEHKDDTEIRAAVSFVLHCLYSCRGNIDFVDLQMLNPDEFGAKINKWRTNQLLSNDYADALERRLNNLRANAIEYACSYMLEISQQAETIANLNPKKNVPESSLIGLMKSNSFVSVNLGADNYEYILRFMLRDLKNNVPRDMQYLVVFDDVNIPQEKKIFEDLITDKRCNFILSYQDITTLPNYGDTGSHLRNFIDKASETIILSHGSGAALILSNALPKYSKYPITINRTISYGDNSGISQSGFMPGSSIGANVGSTLTVSIAPIMNEQPCVSSDLITSLSTNQACIYSREQNRLFFIKI